jgi:endonuclease YncB( thermonuclease family)
MRPAVAVFAMASIAALSLFILASGRDPRVVAPKKMFTSVEGGAPVAAAKPPKLHVRPKPVEEQPEPDATAPADEPRAKSAQSPPAKPGDVDGTVLYRPVARAAGLVEAMGYTVSVAGTEIVDPEETCAFSGRDWACGMAARTAFRSWLRGRALSCDVPDQPGSEPISADCKLGNQDAGAWLVANGWARAAAGGPYAEAGEKARSAKKGIFGPPPSKAGLSEPGTTTSALPSPEPQTDEVFPPPPEAPLTPPVFPPAPVQ